ncbi:putative NUDIX family NTP pyrophosphohydrolase [Neorhizobium sp. R1-B]|jgi:predicted NUDIX family NTP pyrophosphohydrolase|uniref:NUDIX domain-containing protein n=1 Tax=unclassified Neorhizobium TaxID=2629175 RepID=UPI00104942FC|nr:MULTISPECIES: NUDIX domain-containing protein [unclassified Neorhizobium]TCV65437.1 putative NUDIX family NTP pyrophosphohydrolase [Neorhizobium sp. S3-V5DH]TDX76808.1 putative NUDIX family NTP pyrophosphohydrolase [Neorhizobium sp. R1-B]
MPKRSAGLLIFRRQGGDLQVLLVHPGGPFWARKDDGAWSIPKGLVEEGEDELGAAIREAAEEIGTTIEGSFERLGEYRQPGGKRVLVWAVEADPPIDEGHLVSNLFSLEWPPRSGVFRQFPEVDRAGWFSIAEARQKILKGQEPILNDFMDPATTARQH